LGHSDIIHYGFGNAGLATLFISFGDLVRWLDFGGEMMHSYLSCFILEVLDEKKDVKIRARDIRISGKGEGGLFLRTHGRNDNARISPSARTRILG